PSTHTSHPAQRRDHASPSEGWLSSLAAPQAGARTGSGRRSADVNPARLRALEDQAARADNALPRDGNAVANRRIDPQEAERLDRHAARHHDVGSDEAVVPDSRMMP